MKITHDFRGDLDAIDWFGAPFALARFADGELACMQLKAGYRPYGFGMGTETWASSDAEPWRHRLEAALSADLPGYYVGVSAPCCQGPSTYALRSRVANYRRMTYATLFTYGNYDRFRERARKIGLRERSVLVGCEGTRVDIGVPRDAIAREDWDLDGLLTELLEVRRPILVAAGPAACVIVHEYWRRQERGRKQICVDVGSVWDEELHGLKTRMHNQRYDRRRMRRHRCYLHGAGFECFDGCALTS